MAAFTIIDSTTSLSPHLFYLLLLFIITATTQKCRENGNGQYYNFLTDFFILFIYFSF